MAVNFTGPRFTAAELDRLQQRRKPRENSQEEQHFQLLTPAQRKAIEDAELAKCSYRENKEIDCIVIWYDGFPLIEIPKGLFKEGLDFRQIPAEAERILREQKV